MKKILSIALCCISLSIFSQELNHSAFIGMDALERYLTDNALYPRTLKQRTPIKIKADFVVGTDSIIRLKRILKPSEPKREIDREVRRVFKTLPKWIPSREWSTHPEEMAFTAMFQIEPEFKLGTGVVDVSLEKSGTLAETLNKAQMDTCQVLRIQGKINSHDILTLRLMAGADGGHGKLSTLDLSQAEIESDPSTPYLEMDAKGNIAKATISEGNASSIFAGSTMESGYYVTDQARPTYIVGHNPDNIYMTSSSHYMEQGTHHSYILYLSDNTDGSVPKVLSSSRDNSEEEEQVKKWKILEKKGFRKMKGHSIDKENGRYVYRAYTYKNLFCPDMFYRCPELNYVIMPWSSTLYGKVILSRSKLKILR